MFPLARSGKWSTAEEDLADLAREDPFFADYAAYRTAEKLLGTYLRKMGRTRLHPRFGYLLQTGRTYCGGGFNLQNLPKDVRECFVPEPGHLFVVADYSGIELRVAAALSSAASSASAAALASAAWCASPAATAERCQPAARCSST